MHSFLHSKSIETSVCVKYLMVLLINLIYFNTLYGQNYQPISIESGFNNDVIANGIGPSMQSTTAGLDVQNFSLVSRDFQLTSSSPPLTYGLPINGLINTVVTSTPGLVYQLAPYNANNVLRLPNSNDVGTLKFTTPVKAESLFILAASGAASSNLKITVKFTDGSSQVFDNTSISDWYNGSDFAIQGIGRITRTNDVLESGNGSNPRLYQIQLAIESNNYNKPIERVEFIKVSGLGIANVFAISGDLYNSCATPTNIVATTGMESATIIWQTPTSPGNGYDYYLSTTGEIPNTSTVPTGNVLTASISLQNLLLGTTYNLWIRSNCGIGAVGYWKKASFTTGTLSVTYSLGNINTSFSNTVNVNSSTTCPGMLLLSIPSGFKIKNTSVSYVMNALAGARISDQRSLLVCTTNNITESNLSVGSGSGTGSYNYSRTDIPIANGLTGTVNFELRAWRTWGGSECSENYSYVVNGSWTITVTLEKIVLTPANNRLYIKQNGAGNFTGDSWSNAAPELADALVAAKSNTNIKEIWVAGGAYKPMYSPADNNFGNADGRNNAFLLVKDVKVYGGFAGTETTLAQRDLSIVSNKSTLSGDIDANDVITNDLSTTINGNNSYHVLIAAGTMGIASLDGFTITGGNASTNSSITINSEIVAANSGGGLVNLNATLGLSNLKIAYNGASFSGAGIFNYKSATISINNTTIANNKATGNGGGVFSDAFGSSLRFTNVQVVGNMATANGGGICDYSISGNSSFINVLITGNTSGALGGGMYLSSATSLVLNTTIAANTAVTGGGGLHNEFQSPLIYNSIVLGNNTGVNNNNSTPTIKNSLIQDLSSAANGNISATGVLPANVFVSPLAAGLSSGGDYRLKSGSLAVNSGNSTLFTGLDANSKDLDNNLRLVGSNIDMGPYELALQSQTINPIATISKTYGDAGFEPGGTSSSGLSLTYASADNSLAETYQDASDGNKWKIKIKKAGEVNLTASQAGGSGYDPAPDVVFKLTISPKAISILINPTASISKTYDGSTQGSILVADLGFAPNSVVNNDAVNISLSSTAISYDTKDAGTGKTVTLPYQALSLIGTDAGNYSIANTLDLTAGFGIITPANITGIGLADNSFVYDGSAKSLVITGTLPPGTNVSYSNNTLTNAGTQQVRATVSGTNYNNLVLTANLSITPANLTGISLADNSFVYDGTAKSLAITGTLPTGTNVSYSNNTLTNAGTQQVRATLSGANYNNLALTANLTITKASLSIIADAKSKTYGDADPALSYTSTGLIGSGSITGALSRTTGENAGTYAINVGSLTAGNNYSIIYNSANLSINKAMLNVVADNKQICQGSGLPGFTSSYSGFKFNDNESSLSTKSTVNITGSINTAGTYVLIPGGAASNNYNFNYINGSLSVYAKPVPTISNNKSNSVSKGETLVLTAAGGSSYVWSNASGIISGQNTANLTIRPTTTTTYTVTASNGNGCSESTSYRVEVRDDFQAVKANNILTPNGDGINDFWVIENIDMYPNNLVTIFDKAGRVIYTQKGYKNTWDGTVNGSPLSENTYYYIIDFGTDKIKQKGFITLIRQQ